MPNTEDLKRAIQKQAKRAGISPKEMARSLTATPSEKAMAFRPTAELARALEKDQAKLGVKMSQVILSWLQSEYDRRKKQ